jgi:hypothetical protein
MPIFFGHLAKNTRDLIHFEISVLRSVSWDRSVEAATSRKRTAENVYIHISANFFLKLFNVATVQSRKYLRVVSGIGKSYIYI